MANFEPVRGTSTELNSIGKANGQMRLDTDEGKLIFVYDEAMNEIVFNANVIDGGDLDPSADNET